MSKFKAGDTVWSFIIQNKECDIFSAKVESVSQFSCTVNIKSPKDNEEYSRPFCKHHLFNTKEEVFKYVKKLLLDDIEEHKGRIEDELESLRIQESTLANLMNLWGN